MRALLLAALMAGPAMAGDLVAREGSDTLRLSMLPCPPEVLVHIPQGSRGVFRRAFAVIGGAQFVACWAGRTDGYIMLLYADRDVGLWPRAAFKEDDGI